MQCFDNYFCQNMPSLAESLSHQNKNATYRWCWDPRREIYFKHFEDKSDCVWRRFEVESKEEFEKSRSNYTTPLFPSIIKYPTEIRSQSECVQKHEQLKISIITFQNIFDATKLKNLNYDNFYNLNILMTKNLKL